MFLLLLPSSSVPPEQAPIPSLSIIHCCHHLPPPTSLSCALFDCCVVVVVVNGDGGQERTPLSEERRGGHPLRGRLVPSRRRRPLPGPHLCLSCQCRRPLFLLARTEPPVPPGLSHRSSSAPPRRAAMAITAPPARPLTFDAAVSLLPPPPPPPWLIVTFFPVTSHSNCLIVYVIVLHLTAIPALEEPRVHATVTHDACAQMPTRGRLRKGVRKGVCVDICLVEVVSPQDLSWGRMFCWRRRKNTMIYYFYGFTR